MPPEDEEDVVTGPLDTTPEAPEISDPLPEASSGPAPATPETVQAPQTSDEILQGSQRGLVSMLSRDSDYMTLARSRGEQRAKERG